MSDNRDHDLQALFTFAEQDLSDDAFTASVVAKADRLKRRSTAIRIGVILALIACTWLLSVPAQNAVLLLAHWLATPLFPLDNSMAAQILLPLNSIAFPVALVVMAVRRARRGLNP